MIEKALLILSFSTMRYFLIAGVAFILCYVIFSKKMHKSKIQKNKAPKSSFKRDVLHSLQTTIIHVRNRIPVYLSAS